jgi:2-oxoacid:acceptor oxidoreductase delta subunit (pyruvate/2-ketoisovalerate family)
MPAHDFEVREAEEEGVQFRWLSTIRREEGTTFTVEKMKLDDKGFPQPTGELETIDADALVLALGQNVDPDFLQHVEGLRIEDGTAVVDSRMMTGVPGVFAGGDMVPSERSATASIGHGKKAARNIDAWLRGTVYEPPEKHPLASFDRLNTWYYSDAPKLVQPVLQEARRCSTFDEVAGGLDQDSALFEARRCLSCGNCFECNNCYGMCPDNAVIKLGAGERFRFNYEYCKGCGLCAEECPCGAIEMVLEQA